MGGWRCRGSVYVCLLPTGSEEREVLGIGSILPSCQDMNDIALQCINMNIVW